jgi:hypothetical protein
VVWVVWVVLVVLVVACFCGGLVLQPLFSGVHGGGQLFDGLFGIPM